MIGAMRCCLPSLLALVLLPAGALAQEEIPPPPQPIELRPSTVRFRANVPGVRVHYLPDPVLDDDGRGGLRVRLADPSRYSILCDAPCDRELPRAHFALAFSLAGGPLVRAIDPFGVDGHTGVRVRWHDRAALRTAGLWTLILGPVAGASLAIVPISADRASGGNDDAYLVTTLAGAGIVAASIVIGIVLLTMDDGASFSAEPLPDDASELFRSDWQ